MSIQLEVAHYAHLIVYPVFLQDALLVRADIPSMINSYASKFAPIHVKLALLEVGVSAAFTDGRSMETSASPISIAIQDPIVTTALLGII